MTIPSGSTSNSTNTPSDSSSTTGSQTTTSGATTASTGASSAADTGSVPVPTFYEVQTILQNSCVLVSCHSPLYNPPNMSNWDSEALLYARLTAYQLTHCDGAMLLKPGEPENSAMLKVVTHGCGDFIMPPLCEDPCMDPDSYASLQAWIKAGAPTN